ncbi:ImmA/IrrE family metallo-endopeptidase [Streptococcus porcinus]|uniref:ImmA/IrrE family metallo-endopeptidase n=1 Tax=Streptococcus porcinus TaxID=1340 RepID=A0A7V9WSL6_STRPO|nr:ImmA/IrrE family metallo-endopeptidase [Streptococcus porcinus]MBA2796303.1 ImmA/IrrE family metallo-endopeptidase [Streptococcus porcinus]
MENTFSKINLVVQSQLYPFIKLRELSLLSYTFEDFFEHVINENNIKVLGHHFSNRQIEGLTLIDSGDRISLSYEKENPVVRQNFTKCHELGHYLLGHQGSVFTELKENQTTPEEVEANYFSACLLMPDIVLLSKIYYQKSSFQEVANSLCVSHEALNIRLIDLLTYLLGKSRESIVQSVHHYQSGDNRKVLENFASVHDIIVSEYNAYEPRPEDKLNYLLIQKDFVTDNEVAELSQAKFRSLVSSTSVGTWAYYDKGKAIFYAWNKEKLAEGEAYQKAKDIYYLS